MWKYILGRVLQNIVIFFLFLIIVYFLIDAQPGDFGSQFLNDPRLTAEQRIALRTALGLDRTPMERFLQWMGNFFQGDLGISFSNYPRPVRDVLVERAPRTLVLFLTSTIVSFYAGFTSGKFLAWTRGETISHVVTIVGVALYTVFVPWFALMMVWFFSFKLQAFPISGFINPQFWTQSPPPGEMTANNVFMGIFSTTTVAAVGLLIAILLINRLTYRVTWRKRFQVVATMVALLGIVVYWIFFSGGAGRYALDIFWHMILPVVTVTLISFAGQMLLTRNSMLETLREDYILAARAKGLPERVIRDKHAARNAVLPVYTSFILRLPFVMSGGVITESVFSWPGMGLALLVAAQVEDIPMTIGALVFIGALALIAHLVADVMYIFLDPRIRYQAA